MQYILTQKEYELSISEPARIRKEMQEIINELCVEVAKHKPIKRLSDTSEDDPRPWGCHVYNEASREISYYGYCDECPVQSYCKNSKNYSK